MSRAQSLQRCKICNAITSLSHRCQQRPQSKMRGPTSGLSTGPAWDSARWAAHLRGKVEAGERPAPNDATYRGRKVMPGDVYLFRDSARYEVTAVDELDGGRSHRVHAKHNGKPGTWTNNKDNCPFLRGTFKLISRAPTTEQCQPRIGDVYTYPRGTAETGWDRFEVVGRDPDTLPNEWRCKLSGSSRLEPSFASTEWLQRECRLVMRGEVE